MNDVSSFFRIFADELSVKRTNKDDLWRNIQYEANDFKKKELLLQKNQLTMNVFC